MEREVDIKSDSIKATVIGFVLVAPWWFLDLSGAAEVAVSIAFWIGIILLILGLNGLTLYGLKVVFGESSF